MVLLRTILVLVLAVGVVGCHPPSSVTTAPGKAAYSADQVIKRLGEFQNAAIQANQTGGLDTATTRKIVTYVVDTTKTLQAAPSGWVAIVQTGWAAFKPTLPTTVTNNTSLELLVSSLDVMIAGLQ